MLRSYHLQAVSSSQTVFKAATHTEHYSNPVWARGDCGKALKDLGKSTGPGCLGQLLCKLTKAICMEAQLKRIQKISLNCEFLLPHCLKACCFQVRGVGDKRPPRLPPRPLLHLVLLANYYWHSPPQPESLKLILTTAGESAR